jgi:hypothetical protein
MTSAAQFTDPYLHTYTSVPAAGPGVCAVCHSGPRPGFAVCYSCQEVMRQVSHPVTNVIPVSLYTLNSQLWHVLRHYKDGSGHSRELLATQVAAIMARFTAQHLPCVTAVLGGDPALVASVPSTRRAAAPGPASPGDGHHQGRSVSRAVPATACARARIRGSQPGRRRRLHCAAPAQWRTGTRRGRHADDRRALAERCLRAPPARRLSRRRRGRRSRHQPGVERELPSHLGSGPRNPVQL